MNRRMLPAPPASRERIDRVAVPGEEVLLEQGQQAPYRGVLLPPGIYKSVLPEIDRRYDEIYGPREPAPVKRERGLFE